MQFASSFAEVRRERDEWIVLQEKDVDVELATDLALPVGEEVATSLGDEDEGETAGSRAGSRSAQRTVSPEPEPAPPPSINPVLAGILEREKTMRTPIDVSEVSLWSRQTKFHQDTSHLKIKQTIAQIAFVTCTSLV